MESEVESSSRICPITPRSKKGLNQLSRPSLLFMVVGLTLLLTTAGLAYYWMKPPPYIPPPPPTPLQLTPHGPIMIDGDDDFGNTALKDGWPGDGSSENPYLIIGLEIDLGGYEGVQIEHCIMISNTRVHFSIRNCNLTGAFPVSWGSREAGIYLENVTNGELVENIVNSNYNGIIIRESYSNTVANNTCNSNTNNGIKLGGSDYNTVVNNTCSTNGEYGISLSESYSNTVTDNTCNNNTYTPGGNCGIFLIDSDYNTVTDNTCNSNGIGIYLSKSYFNILANNTCLDNIEHDILEHDIIVEFEFQDDGTEEKTEELGNKEFVARESVWFLAGSGMILVISAIALVQFRRMAKLWRIVSNGEYAS